MAIKLDESLFRRALSECCDKDLFAASLTEGNINEIRDKVISNAMHDNENPNVSFLDMRDCVFSAMQDLNYEWPWDDDD